MKCFVERICSHWIIGAFLKVICASGAPIAVTYFKSILTGKIFPSSQKQLRGILHALLVFITLTNLSILLSFILSVMSLGVLLLCLLLFKFRF